MEGWLKAKAEQVAKAAAEAAEGASKLGNELAGQASQLGSLLEASADSPGTRNLTFEAGVLGFHLDGACVVAVDQGGQAAKLGVCIGDTLLAVAGYEVPTPADDDIDAVQRRNRQIKKWIKEAPRPVRLTFKAIDLPSSEDNAPIEVAADPKASESQTDLEAELDLDDAFASLLLEESGNLDSLETGLADSDCLADQLDPGAADHVLYREAQGQVASETQTAEGRAAGGTHIKQASAAEAPLPEITVEINADPLGTSAHTAADSLAEADQAEGETEGHHEEVQLVAVTKMEALQAELLREQEQRAQLSAELIQARHSRARVNTELESERRQNAASRKKIVDLQDQVSKLADQCSELQRAVNSSEKDDHIEREASEAREQVLQDEVGRLRAACAALEASHQAALQAAVEAKVSELQDVVSRHTAEAHELVARAVAAEGTQEVAESNLRRAHEERIAEQASLQIQHQQALGALQQQLQEQEEKAALELQEVKLELESARQTAAEAVQAEVSLEAEASSPEADEPEELKLDVEEMDDAGGQESGTCTTATTEADAADCNTREEETGEVAALRQRLTFLEQRCSTLQKQLNARPIVFQKPKSWNGADNDVANNAARQVSWEPQLRAVAGPRIAQIAVHLYSIPDRVLRNFTHKLLKHDAWLWVFYAHLLVLYTIAASCYAETTINTSNSPVDAINAGVAQAVAGAAPGLAPANGAVASVASKG